MENKGPWQTRQVGFRHNRVFLLRGAIIVGDLFKIIGGERRWIFEI
jgi:hypothetical protein